jgi:hypothetical protein
MAIRASHIFPSLLFACATVAAHAAELGEAQVLSHIGQPLAASVELAMIEDGAAKVGVRLAHPDVYRGANIAMPAVLSSLGMHVTRQGGRQFLHLSTGKPVESRHLHVYLELIDGGQRGVRLVTLWLTPDPNPAPASPAVLRPVAPAARPVPAPRPAAALHEGEEYVEPRNTVAKSTAAPKRQPVDRKAAPAAAAPAAPVKAQALSLTAPGACAPPPAAEQLNACTVLGEKNAALRHELGQLEAKVKVLQAAAGGTPAAAPSAAPAPAAAPAVAPAPASAPAPNGAPRIQLKPRKPAPPEPVTPWGAIAGAAAAGLALAGLVAALLRRRKRSTFGKVPKEHKPARPPKAGEAPEGTPKPSFMSAVKARLMPGSRKNPAPASAPERVEPAAESSET